MANITLNHVRHSYAPNTQTPVDWALEDVTQSFEDGGAYALLGPSGCGKTTLLNIISGLIVPTEGRVLFDGNDVAQVSTIDRKIAQVFQFPVVYDTMSVYDNLAFPLRNRGMSADEIKPRVEQIAQMLDLMDSLYTRASGLTADGKQKISLGRGLVRSDVNIIMFDEPLTVIDPHLKWQLRSKLKQLHQQVGATMIYVTHDQTEALTFADKVVVMFEGRVVQVGTPVELFECPSHTFVGHFIGSPGMNILPAKIGNNGVVCLGHELAIAAVSEPHNGTGRLELGIRPEFISFSDRGIPVRISKVDDLGRHQIVVVEANGCSMKVIVNEDQTIPSESPKLTFDLNRTHLYVDSWMIPSEVCL